MRVIIAGGTGFLGGILTRALELAGDEVIILSRHPEKASRIGQAEIIAWDARTSKDWGERVNQADAIINVVGENIGGGRWTQARKARILNSRVNAGLAISEAVEQASQRPAVLVQMSGIGRYGFSGDRIVNEESPSGSDFLARVTVDWENSTRRVEELGVRRVVVRNAVVLDKTEGIFPLVLLPVRLMVGGPVGSGQQWFPWIHKEDYIQGLLFLMKSGSASGAYNFCAPEAVTYAQLAKTAASVMRRPYWAPAPAFLLKAMLGEMSSLVLEGQHALPERLVQAGYAFRFPVLRQALEDLLLKS